MQALRVQPFRILFAARTISFLGTNLAPIAVAFAVLDLHGGATDIGYAFAAWTLAQVSTLLFAGVVADRMPRRVVMIASDAASFAVRATMGTLLVTGHAQIWELILLQAGGGAAVAFFSPASSGLVPQTVPPELLQEANAYMSIARYSAFPVGAAVGGTIVALIGPGWALLLDAATYATSALLLVRLRLATEVRMAASGFLRELREGWQAFTEHTWVWLLTLWISLYFLITYAPFFVLGPYVAKQSMGGAGAWTAVVTGEGIGSLLGGLAGLRFTPQRRTMVVLGWVFSATAVQSVLLGFRAPWAALAPAAALAGFGFSYGTVIWDTSIQRTIAPEKLSRVSAYNWMGAMVCLPLGYAIAGPVASAIGLRASLLIGAAWILVSTFAVTRARGVRSVELDYAPAIAVSKAAT
jgi:MFS family permease